MQKIEKCTPVEALRHCAGRMAHTGIRSMAQLFLAHVRRRELGLRNRHRSLFTPGKDAVPIVKGAVWAPEPVWKVAENFDTTAILSPTSTPIVSRYAHYNHQPVHP